MQDVSFFVENTAGFSDDTIIVNVTPQDTPRTLATAILEECKKEKSLLAARTEEVIFAAQIDTPKCSALVFTTRSQGMTVTYHALHDGELPKLRK